MTDQTSEPSTLTGARYWSTFVLAVVLVVLFAMGCLMMYYAADNAEEKLWGRYEWVFGALQAVAFTAVGWVFGREVNRSTAETATKQVETARAEAKTARDANAPLIEKVAHGRALADAVRSVSTPATADRALDPSPITSLKSLADSLFPANS